MSCVQPDEGKKVLSKILSEPLEYAAQVDVVSPEIIPFRIVEKFYSSFRNLFCQLIPPIGFLPEARTAQGCSVYGKVSPGFP